MWPKIPSGFVRAVLAGHSALGLFFAGLLYLVCLSGTIVVLHSEIMRWEAPQAPAGLASDATLVNAINHAIAEDAGAPEGEGLHSVGIYAFEDAIGRVTISRFWEDRRYSEEYLDPLTGQPSGEVETPIAEYLERLHIYLRFPSPWGLYLVGLTGVAMLSLVISGILSHPRIFRDAFHFRRGGSERLQEADVHNRLSVWALPFHLVISFTGAFLGLSFLVVAILAMVAFEGDQEAAVRAVLGPQASEDHRPIEMPDLEQVIADARARTGLERLTFLKIDHPGVAGQIIQVGLDTPKDLARGEELFYSANGEFIETGGSKDGTLGPQVLASMGPLHFGVFGGLPVKLAYVLFGLASTVVVSTGVSIWTTRRRSQGRPVPGWERVWIGVAWGSALGCVVPCYAVMLNEAWGTPVLLATLIVSLAAALFAPSARFASLILRSAIAAGVLGLVVTNIWQHGAGALAGYSLLINGLLVLTALVISVALSGVRRPFPSLQKAPF